MSKNKSSKVWSLSREDFSKLIAGSTSYSQVLESLGLVARGSNHKTLYQRIEEEQVDCSHLLRGKGANAGRKFGPHITRTPHEKMFKENSTSTSAMVRRRVVKEALVDYQCQVCGLTDQWQGKEICLQLDHINGINKDHRLENLRFLCPNCHTQTDTYAGRNTNNPRLTCACGSRKGYPSKHCRNCSYKETIRSGSRRKVQKRPSQEELLVLLEEHSYCAVGRMYGVSDNAVRKWLKS